MNVILPVGLDLLRDWADGNLSVTELARLSLLTPRHALFGLFVHNVGPGRRNFLVFWRRLLDMIADYEPKLIGAYATNEVIRAFCFRLQGELVTDEGTAWRFLMPVEAFRVKRQLPPS